MIPDLGDSMFSLPPSSRWDPCTAPVTFDLNGPSMGRRATPVGIADDDGGATMGEYGAVSALLPRVTCLVALHGDMTHQCAYQDDAA